MLIGFGLSAGLINSSSLNLSLTEISTPGSSSILTSADHLSTALS